MKMIKGCGVRMSTLVLLFAIVLVSTSPGSALTCYWNCYIGCLSGDTDSLPYFCERDCKKECKGQGQTHHLFAYGCRIACINQNCTPVKHDKDQWDICVDECVQAINRMVTISNFNKLE